MFGRGRGGVASPDSASESGSPATVRSTRSTKEAMTELDFSLYVPALPAETEVFVCGGLGVLGQWRVDQAHRLERGDEESGVICRGSVKCNVAELAGGVFEYKYFYKKVGSTDVDWEKRASNRVARVRDVDRVVGRFKVRDDLVSINVVIDAPSKLGSSLYLFGGHSAFGGNDPSRCVRMSWDGSRAVWRAGPFAIPACGIEVSIATLEDAEERSPEEWLDIWENATEIKRLPTRSCEVLSGECCTATIDEIAEEIRNGLDIARRVDKELSGELLEAGSPMTVMKLYLKAKDEQLVRAQKREEQLREQLAAERAEKERPAATVESSMGLNDADIGTAIELQRLRVKEKNYDALNMKYEDVKNERDSLEQRLAQYEAYLNQMTQDMINVEGQVESLLDKLETQNQPTRRLRAVS